MKSQEFEVAEWIEYFKRMGVTKEDVEFDTKTFALPAPMLVDNDLTIFPDKQYTLYFRSMASLRHYKRILPEILEAWDDGDI